MRFLKKLHRKLSKKLRTGRRFAMAYERLEGHGFDIFMLFVLNKETEKSKRKAEAYLKNSKRLNDIYDKWIN